MNKTKRVCIVIPIYREKIEPYEQISIDQCFNILIDYDIFFVIPKRLHEFIKVNPYCLSGRAAFHTFKDDFFVDIPGYNRLLKFPGFYRKFLDYDFMLLYQLDAFVFRDELLSWCDLNYDHIGAPLFDEYEQASAQSSIIGQGNGGFSLRKVKTCYNIVRSFNKLSFVKEYNDENRFIFINIYRYIKHHWIFIYSFYPLQPIINEDRFWAEEIPAVFPAFKVPKPFVSISFSFEVNPDLLYELNNKKLPFGCHAWWRYNFDFWKKHIQSYGYKL